MERIPAEDALVIPMPSLAELSSMLNPMHILALEGPIETHSREYRQRVEQRAYKDAPTEFMAFTIPLDSYLALPGGFGATFHTPHEQSASMTMVHNAAMETKVGTKKITSVLSTLVVALGSKDTVTPLADLNETSIMTMYREAIRLANNAIGAYKLTPGRHNHDLRPVTVNDRPSFVDVFRFDTNVGEILEAGTVHMHQNLIASIEHANPMSRQEHANFAESLGMLGSQGEQPAANILATIYQAIDEVCLGNYTSGLVLADTYSEHSMRYALLQLYTGEGLSEEAAMSKIDRLRTLEKLVGELATELHMPRPRLKERIAFEDWRDACRTKRNHITHQFTKLPVEPGEARTALHTTINMITALTRLVLTKNVALAPQLGLFTTPGWYINSIASYDANDDRSLSRVTDIVKYKYHK